MKPLPWLWQFLRTHRGKYLWNNLFLNTLLAGIGLLVPWALGQIIDVVFLAGKHDKIWYLLAILVGVNVVRTSMYYVISRVNERVSQDVTHEIRQKAYRILNSQDFTYFDSTRTGDIMSRMTGDLDTVRYFVAFVMPQLYKSILMIVSSLVMMFAIHQLFAFFIILMSPLIGYFGMRLSKEVRPRFSDIRAQLAKLNTMVQENISGHRVVKAFTRESHETDKFDQENGAYAETNVLAAEVWKKYLPILDFLCNFMNVIVLLAGGLFVVNGSLSLGALVTYNMLLGRLNGPLRTIGWVISDSQRFFASGEKIEQMMSSKPKITNGGVKLPDIALKGGIEFRDVSLSYETSPTLKAISFKIEPGNSIGFVGPTGSGKSTIMSLILRFYEASEGLVLLDRVNVGNIDLKTLRSQISIAMQDVFLFTDTLEGNIAYGSPNATLQDVEEVARLAMADRFIREFPEGYDTIVGERGVGLSGGQRQRIALARTLLTHPSILILDDTTSSLDLETEHEIQKNLKTYRKDQTTLIIAHRISSVKHCDWIYVLDHGSIVEEGTHDTLLANEGYYNDIYQNQLGNFDNKNENMKEVG